MKKLLILFSMLLCQFTMASISKVYIAVENEALSTVPVHGTTSWSTYIGTSKLAFAKGYRYKMKIEFSGTVPPGTIKVSNSFASVSSIVQSGKIFTFNLTIPVTVPRLSTFQIVHFNSSTNVISGINCEVVEIGKLFSLLVRDTTNTMMVGMAPKSDQLLSMTFIKNTGRKDFTFHGSDLSSIVFHHAVNGGQASGLIFNSGSFQSGGQTNFKLVSTVTTVPNSGGTILSDFLSRIIDSAADKLYPWVTYKYARMLGGATGIQQPGNVTGGGTIGGPITTAPALFEVLPGQTISLPAGTSGFNNFLSAGYNIN
jgi:hypothetical protein